MIDIGKRLKRARESLGLTLEDLEAQTRIQKKYLQAIENGQFELLPSPIYVRSYIRSYANAVGENPQMLLKFYQPAHRPVVRPEPVSHETGQYARHALPPADGQEVGRSMPSREYASAGTYGAASAQEAYPAAARSYPSRQESWQETDPQQTRPMRTVRGASYPALAEPRNSAAPSRREAPSRTAGVRRPVMPPDVPEPEELGIEREEMNTAPSRSRANFREEPGRTAQYGEKKKGSSLGKWYTRLLILGAALLLAAAAFFLYYRWENASKPDDASTTAQASQEENSGQQNEGPKKPKLSVLYTSPEFPDRYELVNADTMEVRIKWLKGSPSSFEIRHEEVGEVVAQGEVGPGKDFTGSYKKEIWLKLSKPDKVQVTINGFKVDTEDYSKEKVIRVSLIP